MKFIIQYRLKNHQYATDFMKKLKYDTWQTWKKYKTENQRDKAFEAVKNRDSLWEYRKWTIEK